MSTHTATEAIDFIAAANDFQAQQTAVPEVLKSTRNAGLNALQGMALPTRKTESWKYTSLYPLTTAPFLQAPDTANLAAADLDPYLIKDLDVYRLVFIDGQFNASLSDTIDEITAALFSQCDEGNLIAENLNSTFKLEKHFFAQLNSCLLQDGLLIRIPRNTKVSKPIHLLQLNTQQAEPFYSQQRILVVAEEGSQVTIIDHRESRGESNSLSNSLVEIDLGANANLAHISLQLEAETQIAISGTHVNQSRDSH